jgi:hypothetical protein
MDLVILFVIAVLAACLLCIGDRIAYRPEDYLAASLADKLEAGQDTELPPGTNPRCELGAEGCNCNITGGIPSASPDKVLLPTEVKA